MKILMTGGTGLIGRAFIKQFEDYQFTILTRSIAKLKTPNTDHAAMPAKVKFIESLDYLDDLNDFDAIINLAGEPIIDKRWSAKQKHIICQSRWGLTEQLVALFAASQKPPLVFLNGSAIGAYGDRGDQVITEDMTVEVHDFNTELCLGWEARAMQAQPYTRVVLLRTGIVLTPEGGALGKMLLPFKCCLGGRVGDDPGAVGRERKVGRAAALGQRERAHVFAHQRVGDRLRHQVRRRVQAHGPRRAVRGVHPGL